MPISALCLEWDFRRFSFEQSEKSFSSGSYRTMSNLFKLSTQEWDEMIFGKTPVALVNYIISYIQIVVYIVIVVLSAGSGWISWISRGKRYSGNSWVSGMDFHLQLE